MKKHFFKSVALLILTALLLTGCGGPGNENPTPSPAPDVKLGLHVDENGIITLDGNPYYGFGTNWHGVYQRFRGDSDINLDAYFEALRGAIPYFRFMCGEFYESGVWQYVYDKEAYFSGLDKLVATAEKYQIGLIPSLMWNVDVFYKYYGEDPKDFLGDPAAKGTQRMVQYTTDIVNRYKESPAIWAWEYGNEGNLMADRGSFSSIQLGNAYKLFAETVRKYDDYRIVMTGDSSIFECSHALRTTGKWSPTDTYEERVETLQILNPDPIDCLSTHIYGHLDTYQRVELVATDLEIARNMGKALFVGEYGPGYSEWDTLTGKAMEDNWNDIVDILLADDVQLAAQWGFGRYAEQADGTSIEVGFFNDYYQNVYQYDRLKEVNNNFIKEGKSTAPDYWAKTTPLFYGTEAFKLDGSPYTNSKSDNDLLKNFNILATGLWEGDTKSLEGTAYKSESVVTTALSDGSTGRALCCKVVGDSGISTFPNRFLLSEALNQFGIKLNKGGKYTIKITAKLSFGDGQTALSNGTPCQIKVSGNEGVTDIIADGQWHDYIVPFDAPTGLSKVKVNVGALTSTVGANVGTSLYISNFELYEGDSVQ